MVYYAYIFQMESALLRTLALFMCCHARKDYDNLCSELASFSDDCDPTANTNTNTHTHSKTNANTNAHSNSNTNAHSKTNAYTRSYTTTIVNTNTTSRPGTNKYCAAHSYGNGGCYAS